MPTIRRLNSLTAAGRILAEVQRIIPAEVARGCYLTVAPNGQSSGLMIVRSSDYSAGAIPTRKCAFGRHHKDLSLFVRWGLRADFDYTTNLQTGDAWDQVMFFGYNDYHDAAVCAVAHLERGLTEEG